MKIRILLVLDVRAYAEGLESSLDHETDIAIVGTTTSGRGFAAVAALRPDIVLLDLGRLEKLPLVGAITEQSSETKVVALGVPETEAHVVACAEAGTVGYVPQEASIQTVTEAIRSAARGEALCSPRIAGGLLRRLAVKSRSRSSSADAQPILTRREQEILRLIDEGRSNKEIARALYIEVTTVKNHVHNILAKLGVHRRAEAAARMRRLDANTRFRRQVLESPVSGVPRVGEK
jgi:two-component system nitrate/nitrite response regulator NarL